MFRNGKEASMARTEGGRKKVVGDKVRELKAGPVYNMPYGLL